MTELNDQSLLTHWYRHRNAEAFRVLATRHARMVYATALRILRNAHDAEEVAQQSFLALAQTRRPPSGNVAAWLHRTAYRAALNLTRARNRRTARDHAYAAAQPDSTRTEWDDIRGLVDEAVAGLPDACRECIVLYFFEEQTHAAIGERLGISRQAVAQRIEKGIALVRKRLACKGVVAPAGAALVALIHENSAHALPATLTTELGRIALAGTPSLWAVGATFLSGLGLKAAAAALVVGAAGVVAGIVTDAKEREADADSARSAEAKAVETLEVSRQPEVTVSAPSVVPPVEIVEPVVATVESNAQSVQLASVSGRVVLPDGRPFAGARVTIGPPRSEMDRAIMTGDDKVYLGSMESPVIRSVFQSETNERGEFQMSGIEPGAYRATVVEAGNPIGSYEEHARFDLAAGERKEGLELLFGSEGDLSVSGWVKDSAGAAVAGVHVASAPVLRGARTDAEGRFTLTFLPEGSVGLSLVGMLPGVGYAEHTVAQAGATDVVITLKAFARVEGQVIDARTRQPITSFSVRSQSGHYVPSTDRFGLNQQGEKPGGRFSLESLQAGDTTVLAQAPGYLQGHVFITVEDGKALTGVVVELEPSNITIAGVVVAEDGSPVSGASIHMGDTPMDHQRNMPGATISGSDGAFQLKASPVDVPFVSAIHNDFAPGGSESSEFTKIVLKRAARLNIRTTSAGEPLGGILVRATPLGTPGERVNRTPARGRTELDGRATVEYVAPGPTLVELNFERTRERQVVLDLAPGESKDMTIDFPPADAAVEGTVLTDAAPIGGSFRLFANAEIGEEVYTGKVAEDGTFKIAEAAPGMGTLVVYTNASATVIVEDVRLISGEVTELVVDATMRASVRGAVTGLDAEREYEVVTFRGSLSFDEAVASGDWQAERRLAVGHAIVDASGTFETGIPEPGTYTLLIRSNPRGEYWRKTMEEVRVLEVAEEGGLEVNIELPD